MLVIDPANDLVMVHLRNGWGVSMDDTDDVLATAYAAIVTPPS